MKKVMNAILNASLALLAINVITLTSASASEATVSKQTMDEYIKYILSSSNETGTTTSDMKVKMSELFGNQNVSQQLIAALKEKGILSEVKAEELTSALTNPVVLGEMSQVAQADFTPTELMKELSNGPTGNSFYYCGWCEVDIALIWASATVIIVAILSGV